MASMTMTISSSCTLSPTFTCILRILPTIDAVPGVMKSSPFSYWHQAVFFTRPIFLLGFEHFQSLNQADARFCGHDRAVRVLLGHGLEWSTEFLRELIQLFQPRLFRVCGLFDFFLIQNADGRSEEHTSELQSRQYLVC